MDPGLKPQNTLARDLLPAAALALGFLQLYVRTLCPTVWLGDAGEITTAIATGGVVHPPGYPLFTLLGRVFLALVPTGEAAFRVGCLTATAAALAVGALYFLARETGAPRWASVVVAAAYGASFTFWNQSTRVEVYSLHVLLATLALSGALRYRRTGRFRWLALATVAASLGLAHHLTIVLLAPSLFLILGRRLWTDPRPLPRIAGAAALLVLGPACYLLLIAWARAEPLQAWGHPVTLPLLWNHVSAKQYQGALRLPDWPYFSARARQTGTLLLDNFPWGGFLLVAVGGWLAWKRDRALAAALLLLAGIVTVYNACYHISDIAPYFLTAWLALFLLLGGLLTWADAQCRDSRQRTLLVMAAGLFLVVGPLVRNWSGCDLSGVTWVREFARHKLESAPPNAVLITHEDPDSFPVWYAHYVLKVRPDVLPIDYGLLRWAWSGYGREPSLWYIYHLRREGVPLPAEAPAARADRVKAHNDDTLWKRTLALLEGRPLCVTFLSLAPRRDAPLFRWLQDHYVPLPEGIVLRLHPKEEPVDLEALLRHNAELWSRIRLPDYQGTRTDQEMFPDYPIHHYAAMLVNFGGLYEKAGHPDRAAALYRMAAEFAPSYAPAREALAALQPTGASPGER